MGQTVGATRRFFARTFIPVGVAAGAAASGAAAPTPVFSSPFIPGPPSAAFNFPISVSVKVPSTSRRDPQLVEVPS